VLALLSVFVDIMLHRRGPDTLPSSGFLLWLLFGCVLATSLAIRAIDDLTPLGTLVTLLIAGFELWFVWAVLRAFGREPRFWQAMTAVLGTDLIFNVIRAPIVPFFEPPTSAQQELSLAWFALALLELWSIDVLAFVLSRALERPYLLCLAIVIAYVFLMASLELTLMPRPVV
jgi:hypothetical protein